MSKASPKASASPKAGPQAAASPKKSPAFKKAKAKAKAKSKAKAKATAEAKPGSLPRVEVQHMLGYLRYAQDAKKLSDAQRQQAAEAQALYVSLNSTEYKQEFLKYQSLCRFN